MAVHYERDFGAVRLPMSQLSDPRYLIADETTKIRRKNSFLKSSPRCVKKYDVHWASATPKEQAFIEEMIRGTDERDSVLCLGTPMSDPRPPFAS